MRASVSWFSRFARNNSKVIRIQTSLNNLYWALFIIFGVILVEVFGNCYIRKLRFIFGRLPNTVKLDFGTGCTADGFITVNLFANNLIGYESWISPLKIALKVPKNFFEQFRSDHTSKLNQNNRMIFLQVEKPKTKRCH